MKIEVQLRKSSLPIVYDNAVNAYEKGSFYCVLFVKNGERKTHKYPIVDIFRVEEDYPESKREFIQPIPEKGAELPQIKN